MGSAAGAPALPAMASNTELAAHVVHIAVSGMEVCTACGLVGESAGGIGCGVATGGDAAACDALGLEQNCANCEDGAAGAAQRLHWTNSSRLAFASLPDVLSLRNMHWHVRKCALQATVSIRSSQ
jgi:hypothetical protein